MTPTEILLAFMVLVLAFWYRWDATKKDQQIDKLLDRIQAQVPGALAELTNRELVVAEQARAEPPAPLRLWQPPVEIPEEDAPQMVEVKARAAAGDAAFL